MRVSYETELKGRTVIDSAGAVVGSIDDVLVDGVSWRVDAFRVRLRRDAADQVGVRPRLFRDATVVVPVGLVHAAGDAIILNVAIESLRELDAAGDISPPAH
jgi:sporulation protein YlmC with PRC-barrel domain